MWPFSKSKSFAVAENKSFTLNGVLWPKPRHPIEAYKAMDIEFTENSAGQFQVWKNGRCQVLRPCKFEWLEGYQSGHGWMFFNSKKAAQNRLDDMIDYEIGKREKRTYKFTN